MSGEIDPLLLSNLYRWIDTIPLDRPKKNIARDFSDGVLMSQVLHYFFPKLVELHNYSATNSVEQKQYNWKTLNQKVFKKMGFMISPNDIEAVILAKKFAIERVLLLVQVKIAEYQAKIAAEGGSPSTTTSINATPSYAQPLQRPISPAHASSHSIPQQPQASAAAARKDLSPAHSRSPARSHSHKPSGGAAPPAPTVSSPTNSNSRQTAAAQNTKTKQTEVRSPPGGNGKGKKGGVDEKDVLIQDLRETVDILQLKVQKLEQLLRLKNSKIDALQKKLEDAGL